MQFSDSFKKSLFSTNASNFNERALKLFNYQAENNPIYNKYLEALNVRIESITHYNEIPFLPIEFFKKHEIITANKSPKVKFQSSGTTGQERSIHYVSDPDFYLTVSENIFEQFYGSLHDMVILALLPSYHENPDSSLIFMIDYFINKSQSSFSTYYRNSEEVIGVLKKLESSRHKILFWGVSYALLDLAEKQEVDLSSVILMETGGMKGRRKELTRDELHTVFKERFNAKYTHSEYGMSELLSQAYSQGNGIFQCPSWMKVLTRELEDPFQLQKNGKIGAINVIDFANIDSCSFIETKDLGILYQDGCFEVKGRMDNSDVRGCNLLYTG